MHRLYSFFIILFLSSSVYTQSIKPVSGIENEIAKTESKRFPVKNCCSKTHIGDNYDVKHHRFNWYIDPGVYYIKGSVFTTFQVIDSNFQTIEFEMDSALNCDSVLYHGSSVSFNHDKQNHVLTISLPGALSINILDSIEVFYQGAPNSQTGFGSFEQDYHNNVPVLWTLSQPYGTREWWPCKNNLSDKIDSVDVIVTTPKQYRVASNGVLVKEETIDSNKVYTWKHRYPIAAYLIAVAVTNYAHYSHYVPNGNDSIEILNYVFPEDSASSFNSTYRTIEILDFYNKQFEVYPYHDEKYGHAQFGWGGGMEHQTMSFMGGFGYELISHELAHQWFGDMITCGSWHDIWLNEGFATYLSGLCYEHLDSVFNYWEIWKNAKIAHITQYPGGSVYVYDTTSVGRIFSGRLSYSKGAMTLHMIRWVIGDSAFYAGIHNYLNDPFLRFGYAYTEDLRNHFEQTSGINLTEFFNDWVFGQGHPVYTINVKRNPGNNCEVTINQSPSHSSVSFFEMPVELKFIGNNADTSIVFNHTVNGQVFNVNTGFEVQSVEFDPNIWLVAELDTLMLGMNNTILQNSGFSIYPNPSTDRIYIKSEKNAKAVELITYTGKIVKTAEFFNYNNNFELDLTGLKSGIYLVRIRTENAVITEKIIKK